MMKHNKRPGPHLAVVVAAAASLLSGGCRNHLAFGTATKFGLDISQRPDQQVEVTMGYRRSEMASIPVAENGGDANGTNDAYSVLSRFYVSYGNPFKLTEREGLHLKQFFATGMAAREAANNADMRTAFGRAAGEVKARQEGAAE